MFSLVDIQGSVQRFLQRHTAAQLLFVTVDKVDSSSSGDTLPAALCLGVLDQGKLSMFLVLATKFASALLPVRLTHCTN